MTLSNLRLDFVAALRYPRVRIGVLCLGMMSLLLLGVASGIWWPSWRASSDLQSRIEGQRRINAENISLVDVAARVAWAAQQVDDAEKKLNSATSQAALVQNLRHLATQTRVKILSEAYEQGKAQDGYAPFLHELVLQGTYADIRQFLFVLQSMPTLTLVQEATLTRDAQSSVLKAQLRMLTYRKTPAS